jgi:protease-4
VKQPDLVDYTQKESIGERVARKFGAAVGNASMSALMMGGKMQLK